MLAYAEAHGVIAFTDDQAAIQVGRERGVKVVRTLALVARGVRNGLLTEDGAGRLVDDLIRAGGRYPFQSGEFVTWARDEGLFDKTGE